MAVRLCSAQLKVIGVSLHLNSGALESGADLLLLASVLVQCIIKALFLHIHTVSSIRCLDPFMLHGADLGPVLASRPAGCINILLSIGLGRSQG